MNRLGIVVVTYNSETEIGVCLDACLALVPQQGVEMVVVDNHSSDKTSAEVMKRPGVRLIRNETNEGFAAAANRGIASIECEHVLLLNPDVRLMTGIEPLLECCDGEGVAAASGKLVGPEGRFQAGFAVRRFPSPGALVLEVLGVNRIWPGNPVNRQYRCLDLDPEQGAAVEQPAGAFLMIRREVWQELGGFDETFQPLWFEDVDFLKRVSSRGHQIIYVPSVVARHRGGHSIGGLPWGCVQVCWYGSLLRYACKHFGMWGKGSVSVAVIVGITARAVARVFREHSLKPIGICVQVVALALSAAVNRQEAAVAASTPDRR
jgi:hypothetical protein